MPGPSLQSTALLQDWALGNAQSPLLVVDTCDSRTWEAEAGSWQTQGQPETHRRIVNLRQAWPTK